MNCTIEQFKKYRLNCLESGKLICSMKFSRLEKPVLGKVERVRDGFPLNYHDVFKMIVLKNSRRLLTVGPTRRKILGRLRLSNFLQTKKEFLKDERN